MAAQTYTLSSVGTAFAANKSMMTIYNGPGSGRVVRIYRIWILNNQTVAVTGVLTALEIRRITASSGGVALLPMKHDSTNENLPSQITCTTAATDTLESTFRRIIWSNDEPALSGATIDELECLVPFNCIWDAGYGDANVEPIVLREGFGLTLRHVGSTVVGVADIFFEFTLSNS